jgi:hypothetical protein
MASEQSVASSRSEMVAFFQSAHGLDRQTADLLYRAERLQEKGQIAQAIVYYNEVLQVVPGCEVAQQNISLLARTQLPNVVRALSSARAEAEQQTARERAEEQARARAAEQAATNAEEERKRLKEQKRKREQDMAAAAAAAAAAEPKPKKRKERRCKYPGCKRSHNYDEATSTGTKVCRECNKCAEHIDTCDLGYGSKDIGFCDACKSYLCRGCAGDIRYCESCCLVKCDECDDCGEDYEDYRGGPFSDHICGECIDKTRLGDCVDCGGPWHGGGCEVCGKDMVCHHCIEEAAGGAMVCSKCKPSEESDDGERDDFY